MHDAFDPLALLRELRAHEVEFVVIGAVAAIAQGYPLTTGYLDITPARGTANLERLADALNALGAELRTPDGSLPFPIDPLMLAQAETWTLATRHGDLDLVFAPAGTGGYPDLVRNARELDLGGPTPVAHLADVIRSKEAANRPKDQAQLPALRQTLEVLRRRGL